MEGCDRHLHPFRFILRQSVSFMQQVADQRGHGRHFGGPLLLQQGADPGRGQKHGYNVKDVVPVGGVPLRISQGGDLGQTCSPW